jgi:hypothetical protein
MSPSPVRAISSCDRTEMTCGVRRMLFGMRVPRMTMSGLCGAWAPGAEISISGSGGWVLAS